MPVRIRDLTIEYSSGGYRVRPIDHLDLDIEDGEIVLLLGASGCGKTTLLSALAAILTPTSGTIEVNGVDVTSLSGHRLTDYRRNQVGIVFQAFNLVPSLSALENVAAPMLTGGRRRGAMARAGDLLAQVDLTDRARHRPADLSGGQQQRVAIARALAADPPLLLADEPTAHLDYVQVEGVLRLLQQLRSSSRVIVIATHDERLLPLADRVVHLSPRTATSDRHVERSLVADEILFHQGDDGDYVYVVESGTIELLRERVDGRPDVIGLYQAGSYFGELAPLYGLRRSATARAVFPTHVVGYSATEFRQRQHERVSAEAGAVTGDAPL
jgi:putative ABC transport system ATP-binding protein